MSDPYIWLEDLSSEKVLKWVEEQDRQAREYVREYSNKLYDRYLKLNQEPLYYSFKISEKGYFHMVRSREFKINLIHRDGESIELVRSTDLGRDVVIVNYFVSRRGDLLAFYYSEGGRDVGRLIVIDTDTGERIDSIEGSVHGVVFLDRSRIYYSRFYRSGRCPDGVKAPCDRVFLRDSGRDELVFGENLPTSNFIAIRRSSTADKVILNVSYGWSRSTVYGGDVGDPGSWRRLYGGDHMSVPIDYLEDGCLAVVSYDQGGMGRIICVDSQGYREVIPEGREYIDWALLVGGFIAVGYIDRGCFNKIIYYSREGEAIDTLYPEVPSTIVASPDHSMGGEAILEMSSYIQRYRIVKIDTGDLKGKTLVESRRLDNVDIEHGWARSHDGTDIHYFIVKRRDTDLSRVVLYGYGGFGIALKPTYYIWSIPLIEDGGALVVANLRGGSEYGEAWHRAGMRHNKINVFKDFIAVAEELRRKGSKIVAHGRSNGGLLVGAVMTMRPDLFNAAVIGYPVLDMLRFDKLYIGRAWVPEYGDPENEEDRRYLESYSPYHRIERGRSYPPAYIYTGLNDDRVHPAHAFKFHARLREYGYESYLRVERVSGHIGSTPEIVAREMSDVMGFIYMKLGLEPR